MNERIHILITGESGKTYKIHLPRRKICILAMGSVMLLIGLTVTSLFSISLLSSNRNLTSELAELKTELGTTSEHLAQIKRQANAERSRLNLQITSLKLKHASQLASFEEEKDHLLSTAVSQLNERSELIENMMKKIGVKVGTNSLKKPTPNSGGPFIELHPGLKGELVDKADAYLEIIRTLPLGRPVQGQITSRFGPRRDPVNNRRGFHEGIDFRGQQGDKIHATAGGVVISAGRNGSYGNQLVIDHGNGYTTSFSHLKKFTVKEGEHVSRGQFIGVVGNTGRSTGPHLHYEILHQGEPVNPLKFLQVAKLIEPLASTE